MTSLCSLYFFFSFLPLKDKRNKNHSNSNIWGIFLLILFHILNCKKKKRKKVKERKRKEKCIALHNKFCIFKFVCWIFRNPSNKLTSLEMEMEKRGCVFFTDTMSVGGGTLLSFLVFFFLKISLLWLRTQVLESNCLSLYPGLATNLQFWR